jgi:hypothetical protein
MKTPQEMAAAIIQRANDGYHRDAGDYPPFALTPWDDRIRWSGYIEKCAAEVLAEELASS